MHERSGLLSLPNELTYPLFGFLANYDLLALRQVCTTLREQVDGYERYAGQRFYYAVGTRIPIYEPIDVSPFGGPDFILGKASNLIRQVYPEEIYNALPTGNFVKLFARLDLAKKYCETQLQERYIRAYDIYDKEAIPAVYLVELKNALLTKTTPYQNHQAYIRGFTTNKNNINKIAGAIFNMDNIKPTKVISQHFFADEKEDCFRKLWTASQKNLSTLNDTAYQAVLIFFQGYAKPFYASFTRHHHQEAQEIITFLQAKPKLNKVLGYLEERVKLFYRDAADKKIQVNENGHYIRMLNHCITQLQRMREMLHLPDVKHFFVLTKP